MTALNDCAIFESRCEREAPRPADADALTIDSAADLRHPTTSAPDTSNLGESSREADVEDDDVAVAARQPTLRQSMRSHATILAHLPHAGSQLPSCRSRRSALRRLLARRAARRRAEARTGLIGRQVVGIELQDAHRAVAALPALLFAFALVVPAPTALRRLFNGHQNSVTPTAAPRGDAAGSYSALAEIAEVWRSAPRGSAPRSTENLAARNHCRSQGLENTIARRKPGGSTQCAQATAWSGGEGAGS